LILFRFSAFFDINYCQITIIALAFAIGWYYAAFLQLILILPFAIIFTLRFIFFRWAFWPFSDYCWAAITPLPPIRAAAAATPLSPLTLRYAHWLSLIITISASPDRCRWVSPIFSLRWRHYLRWCHYFRHSIFAIFRRRGFIFALRQLIIAATFRHVAVTLPRRAYRYAAADFHAITRRWCHSYCLPFRYAIIFADAIDIYAISLLILILIFYYDFSLLLIHIIDYYAYIYITPLPYYARCLHYFISHYFAARFMLLLLILIISHWFTPDIFAALQRYSVAPFLSLRRALLLFMPLSAFSPPPAPIAFSLQPLNLRLLLPPYCFRLHDYCHCHIITYYYAILAPPPFDFIFLDYIDISMFSFSPYDFRHYWYCRHTMPLPPDAATPYLRRCAPLSPFQMACRHCRRAFAAISASALLRYFRIIDCHYYLFHYYWCHITPLFSLCTLIYYCRHYFHWLTLFSSSHYAITPLLFSPLIYISHYDAITFSLILIRHATFSLLRHFTRSRRQISASRAADCHDFRRLMFRAFAADTAARRWSFAARQDVFTISPHFRQAFSPFQHFFFRQTITMPAICRHCRFSDTLSAAADDVTPFRAVSPLPCRGFSLPSAADSFITSYYCFRHWCHYAIIIFIAFIFMLFAMPLMPPFSPHYYSLSSRHFLPPLRR